MSQKLAWRLVCCGLGVALIHLAMMMPGFAADWPRFRGPNADGVVPDDPRLPETWNTTNNVRWVTAVPGWGWSSPIVTGERVFLTSVVSDESNEAPRPGLYLGQGVDEPARGTHHWLVHCFDLNSGKLLWKREAHAGRPNVPRHPKSTYAAETPVTDGERVFALFGDLGLFCYDLKGRLLWSQKFEPRKTLSNYGAAASPVVHDGQVIVVYDNQEDSFIASFDATTGRQRWREKRDEPSTWATPCIWQHQRTEIVVGGRKKNRAYDLSGNVLWEFNGRMSGLVIPSPFASDGLLYITSGYVGDAHRPVFAIKPGAAGDISLKDGATTNEFIAWYQPKAGPYNPSPIVYRERYYTLYDQGFLTCHDARTGSEVYGKTRFPGGTCSFTASPWACNGRLFFLSEAGDTYVVEAGPEFKLLYRNPLGELCLASPAVSQGNLLVRTVSKLYCIASLDHLKK